MVTMIYQKDEYNHEIWTLTGVNKKLARKLNLPQKGWFWCWGKPGGWSTKQKDAAYAMVYIGVRIKTSYITQPDLTVKVITS